MWKQSGCTLYTVYCLYIIQICIVYIYSVHFELSLVLFTCIDTLPNLMPKTPFEWNSFSCASFRSVLNNWKFWALDSRTRMCILFYSHRIIVLSAFRKFRMNFKERGSTFCETFIEFLDFNQSIVWTRFFHPNDVQMDRKLIQSYFNYASDSLTFSDAN